FGLRHIGLQNLRLMRGGRAVHPELATAKLQSLAMDGAHDSEIDILLDVHVDVVVGAQYVIDHFELQATFHELKQVSAIKTGVLKANDVLLDLAVDELHLIRGGAVSNHELERYPAQIHALVVLDRLLQQFRIGANDLLAAQAANAGRLETHVFDAPRNVPHHNEVARFERLIEPDRRGSEQVAQHHLRGQRHGHAADPQAGDERRDV